MRCFVDYANDGFSFDRDRPPRSTTIIGRGPFQGSGHRRDAVQARGTVRVIDDDVSQTQVLDWITGEWPGLEIVEIVVIDALCGQIAGIAVNPQPVLSGSG